MVVHEYLSAQQIKKHLSQLTQSPSTLSVRADGKITDRISHRKWQ